MVRLIPWYMVFVAHRMDDWNGNFGVLLPKGVSGKIYDTSIVESGIIKKYILTKEKEWHMEQENMKSETGSLSVCGSDCSTCYCFGNLCAGCHTCSGKVFHVPEGKACAIYDCTVNNKGLKHCGQCSEAPCDVWMKTRDPKYSDEEFAENVRVRMDALKKMAL